MFRHAMASAMLNQGAPLSLIQDVLGHANVNTTKKGHAVLEQRALRTGSSSSTRALFSRSPSSRPSRSDGAGADMDDT
jgi:Phage integrase family